MYLFLTFLNHHHDHTTRFCRWRQGAACYEWRQIIPQKLLLASTSCGGCKGRPPYVDMPFKARRHLSSPFTTNGNINISVCLANTSSFLIFRSETWQGPSGVSPGLMVCASACALFDFVSEHLCTCYRDRRCRTLLRCIQRYPSTLQLPLLCSF